jgi:Plavaka transposase
MPAEKLELWRRDPVECVKELMGNPALKNYMKYAPERVYEDVEGETRIFDEMWTADWWWDTQVKKIGLNNFQCSPRIVFRKNCQWIQLLLR